MSVNAIVIVPSVEADAVTSGRSLSTVSTSRSRLKVISVPKTSWFGAGTDQWPWTIFHSSSSRWNTKVARSDVDVGAVTVDRTTDQPTSPSDQASISALPTGSSGKASRCSSRYRTKASALSMYSDSSVPNTVTPSTRETRAIATRISPRCNAAPEAGRDGPDLLGSIQVSPIACSTGCCRARSPAPPSIA
jgi:hypothetical protein